MEVPVKRGALAENARCQQPIRRSPQAVPAGARFYEPSLLAGWEPERCLDIGGDLPDPTSRSIGMRRFERTVPSGNAASAASAGFLTGLEAGRLEA